MEEREVPVYHISRFFSLVILGLDVTHVSPEAAVHMLQTLKDLGISFLGSSSIRSISITDTEGLTCLVTV